MTMRRDVTAGLGVAMLTLSVRPGMAGDPSARAFLERIYGFYVGRPSTDGVKLDNAADIRRLFDPKLAALILADQSRAAQRDEPPALDSDPFVDAQDWVIRDLEITVEPAGPNQANGFVSFTNLDQPVQIRLALVRLASGWRVHEITYDQTTLSRILTAP